jgi:hypothetical protein
MLKADNSTLSRWADLVHKAPIVQTPGGQLGLNLLRQRLEVYLALPRGISRARQAAARPTVGESSTAAGMSCSRPGPFPAG